jgi:hypothetical protein
VVAGSVKVMSVRVTGGEVVGVVEVVGSVEVDVVGVVEVEGVVDDGVVDA